jgi:hypothetical protein
MSHPNPAPIHLRHSAFLPAMPAPQTTEPTAESREPVQIMVIGSAQGIEATIQNLHLRGFAHINEWSLAMPHSAGKLMRVLTRGVQQQPYTSLIARQAVQIAFD